MLSPFVTCLVEQLEKKRYGEKRQAEIVDRFQGLRAGFVRSGAVDPDTRALTQVLDELQQATAIKQRLQFDALLKHGERKKHFDNYDYNKSIVGSGKEADPGQAAVALLSADPRSKSGMNVESYALAYKGAIFKAMDDVLDRLGKGVFGLQKGKAYMDNVIDEVFGKATGDDTAKQIAASWNKGANVMVDMFNDVGGALAKLRGWGLPQSQTLSKVVKAGEKTWVADHMKWVDWDKMRWPNGAPIEPADRTRALLEAYETLSTDGANGIKTNAQGFVGNGSIGNYLDQHRFLIFKDGDSWRAMHEKYGDGNVFDVMANHVDGMSYKMGLVRTFGANVEAGMSSVQAMALKRAADLGGGEVVQQTKATLGRYQLLTEQALRRNSMDPESWYGNAIIGVSNVLNSAQLAGAVLAAVPGDFATTIMMRAANHMSILDGLVGPYLKGLVTPNLTAKLSAEAGFIMDSVVHTIYTKSRFSGFNEYGPAWTRRLADTVMRASGMNVHTDTVRWANQMHFLGMMARDAATPFADLPWAEMAQRYGITSDMWERFRTLTPYSPRANVEQLRPIDILDSKIPGKQDLYERFQSMILQESRYMVVDTNPEANVMLKGNLRPDTLAGSLLHSFAMYKNFPIGLALSYGRVAMSIEGKTGRLAFLAGLGSSLLLAGGVGIQLREMSKGRDALPMNTPGFWGKAALASGAMSLWGDFLFYGINGPGSPSDIAGGPIANFIGDTTQLAFGSMFDWADHVGSLKPDSHAKTPWAAKAVEYASRYQPGGSLWYARLALQRELYDPMRMLADPRGAVKMMHKERQRVKDFGNESYWAPGDTAPSRLPNVITGGR